MQLIRFITSILFIMIFITSGCTQPDPDNGSGPPSEEGAGVLDGTESTGSPEGAVSPVGENEDPSANEDSLYVMHIMENELYIFGYMDYEGNIVIEPQYLGGRDFCEGLAAVAVGEVPDLRWGFIDKAGQYVAEPQYLEVSDFSEGLARVRVWAENQEEQLCGFIDKKGEMVIEPQWFNARQFFEGYAFIWDENNFGFIDTSGKKVISVDVEYSDFFDGLAVSIFQDVTHYINTSGEVALTVIYDKTRHFTDGLAPVQLNGMSGYINMEGEIAIPLDYELVTDFIDGSAMVSKLGTGKFQLIDTKGEVLMETANIPAGPYSEGLAAAVETIGSPAGYMDLSGEMVIEPRFTDTWPFNNGLAMVRFEGGYGYIDHSGEFVWEYVY